MAHFYGTLQGNRQLVSRCGSKSSGIHARAQGWLIGGRVLITHQNERDELTLVVTAGTNDSTHILLPKIFRDQEGNITSENPLMRELLEQQK